MQVSMDQNKLMFEDIQFPNLNQQEMNLSILEFENDPSISNLSQPHINLEKYEHASYSLPPIQLNYQDEFIFRIGEGLSSGQLLRRSSQAYLIENNQSQTISQMNNDKKGQKPKKKVFQRPNLPKKKSVKKIQDTKNMLASFKKIFTNIIGKDDAHLQNQSFNNFFHNPPNLRSFQNLICDQSLRPLLAKIFLRKQIERGVIQSRMAQEQKPIHLKYINILKKAFLTKKFAYIR